MPVDRKLFAEMFKLFDSALGLTHHALMVSIFLLYSLFLQHQSKLAKLLFQNMYEWIVCPIKKAEQSYSKPEISLGGVSFEIYFVKWKLNHNGQWVVGGTGSTGDGQALTHSFRSYTVLIFWYAECCTTQIFASQITKKVSNISLVDYIGYCEFFQSLASCFFSPTKSTLYPTRRAASDHSFFIYSIFWFWFYSIVCWLFHSIFHQQSVTSRKAPALSSWMITLLTFLPHSTDIFCCLFFISFDFFSSLLPHQSVFIYFEFRLIDIFFAPQPPLSPHSATELLRSIHSYHQHSKEYARKKGRQAKEELKNYFLMNYRFEVPLCLTAAAAAVFYELRRCDEWYEIFLPSWVLKSWIIWFDFLSLFSVVLWVPPLTSTFPSLSSRLFKELLELRGWQKQQQKKTSSLSLEQRKQPEVSFNSTRDRRQMFLLFLSSSHE